jgi:acetyl-CoA C-acetyltransferase
LSHVFRRPPHIHKNGLTAATTTSQHPKAVQQLGFTTERNQRCIHNKRKPDANGSGEWEHVRNMNYKLTLQFNGNFTTVSATQLGATAIKDALEKSKVPVSSIDAVYMGNVLGAGVGQAPARQAAIFAGLPTNIEATTINKVCASGLKAVNIAASTIELGQAEAQVAGGMENMTRVPYYLNRASQQPAFGHQKLQDGLISDGLWDVYNQIHMGNCAENTAKKYEISRQDQDDYAIETYKRAQKAYKEGLFKEEIVPVTVKSKKGDIVISEDEQYNKLKLDKVPTLKPAFEKGPNGTVTAANSSPLSDGASALVLGSKEIAQQYGKDSRVLAKIITYADAAVGMLKTLDGQYPNANSH